MKFNSYQEPGARYSTLLMRAKLVEQKALQQLSDARDRVDLESEKLHQLQSYTHTNQTPAANHINGARASTLANRHAFMCRLQQAIHMQQQQINKLRQRAEQARQSWIMANSETRRYEQLIENERQRARRQAAHREQKELDEIAQQAHRILHHGNGG